MSAIAGIISLGGAPIGWGSVEKMTTAMARRGPDGVRHWVHGSAALGQCMFRTTPESLCETQPLLNEDETIVLVMDGRVDNWEDLRAELLLRGSVLRDRSDAELVLRAYETWGEDCPGKLVGSFVFFIWDARSRQLFGARDAVGGRHLYYHIGEGWFGFASEIKGLLALGRIDRRLNEARLLEYLLPELSGDDVVSTFYKDIYRLPAGHAMRASAQGISVWRYWNPADLPAMTFKSLDECAEAFLNELRAAVKCSLRSIGPVGSTLSGGLDSSSLVGLVSKEFRGDLTHPLRTLSITREDRENCRDWPGISEMLKDSWLEPTVLTSDLSSSVCEAYLDSIVTADEPFAMSHGLFTFLACEWAQATGVQVILTGVAGDLLFYGYNRSLEAIFRRKLYSRLPAMLAAAHWHGDTMGGVSEITRASLAAIAPKARDAYRWLRDKRASPRAQATLLRPEVVRRVRDAKRPHRAKREADLIGANDQAIHANNFTGELLTFASETGAEALSRGVEGRSPYANRRMVEFAIRMPLEAKLFLPCYKFLLRKAMNGVLPEKLRWNRALGANPLSKFYEGVISETLDSRHPVWHRAKNLDRLSDWVDISAVKEAAKGSSFFSRRDQYRLVVLNHWLNQAKI